MQLCRWSRWSFSVLEHKKGTSHRLGVLDSAQLRSRLVIHPWKLGSIMAHAASHLKKARVEIDQLQLDTKALEKARERRRRSRERAERKRKVCDVLGWPSPYYYHDSYEDPCLHILPPHFNHLLKSISHHLTRSVHPPTSQLHHLILICLTRTP